jgi:hypothetical protein
MLEKLRQPANCLCAMILAVFSLAISARAADEVLDWIHVMNDTVIAGGTNPLATSRTVALVSASVFDAVNGIEPRYDHFLVEGNPPRPASQRAAAVESAYTMLTLLYPAQATSLTTARNSSILDGLSILEASVCRNRTAAARPSLSCSRYHAVYVDHGGVSAQAICDFGRSNRIA